MANHPARTLVVMPAFNEEASVAAVIEEVKSKVLDADILVVDDASTDQTSMRAQAAGAIVARLPFNLGVGGAMRLGFRFALEHDYDNVVQIDADGQHDPAAVHALLAALENADLVLGARFAGEGDYAVRGPRRWAMVALAGILSRTSGARLTDTTSGFRASGRRAIALFAEHYPAEYLGDTIEALVIASRSGLRIVQIPVAMRPRAGGMASNNPIRSANGLARTCLALAFAYIRPASTYRIGSRS